MLYEECMTAFFGMRIRHDNLLFQNMGSDQLRGVLVDIDDASVLSVEHKYMYLFILFYGNYEQIIDTMHQLGLSLTNTQEQFFRFVSNITRKAQRMPPPISRTLALK